MALNQLWVDGEALGRNAEQVVNWVSVPVIGVVKCGGYGVSVTQAARAWQQAGVKTFAVAKPEEALELRQGGFMEDILLLVPVAEEQTFQILLKQGIIFTVTGPDCGRRYLRWGLGQAVRVHVAVDTGMGRFGVRWTELEALEAIYRLEGLVFEGIFSHFAKSYERKDAMTWKQLGRFLTVTEHLTRAGYSVGIRHIANSCAALRFPGTRLDAVRVGSALVGQLCGKVPIRLEPAAVLRAQVVDVRLLRRGDTTGYGGVCRMKRDTRVAVVAVGREDGFGWMKAPDALGWLQKAAWLLRTAKQSLKPLTVQWQGRDLPLVGRVGTQYTLFAVGEAAVTPGDWVSVPAPLLFPGRSLHFEA